MAVPSARFSSSFLTWQFGPPRPQVIRDVINVHMEELSSHWQEEQEKEADGADKYVAVSSVGAALCQVCCLSLLSWV